MYKKYATLRWILQAIRGEQPLHKHSKQVAQQIKKCGKTWLRADLLQRDLSIFDRVTMRCRPYDVPHMADFLWCVGHLKRISESVLFRFGIIEGAFVANLHSGRSSTSVYNRSRELISDKRELMGLTSNPLAWISRCVCRHTWHPSKAILQNGFTTSCNKYRFHDTWQAWCSKKYNLPPWNEVGWDVSWPP